MDDNAWTGFLLGALHGWDMDTDDLETIGITPADTLAEAQGKLRRHVGETDWTAGLARLRYYVARRQASIN